VRYNYRVTPYGQEHLQPSGVIVGRSHRATFLGGEIRRIVRSPRHFAVLLPPYEWEMRPQGWTPTAACAELGPDRPTDDYAGCPALAEVRDAFAVVLPGLPLDFDSPSVEDGIYAQLPRGRSFVSYMGPYFLRLTPSAAALRIMLEDESRLPPNTEVSDRLAWSVFPLYLLVSFVSTGEYHRLFGRAPKGHRSLGWDFTISGENLAGFIPGLAGSRSRIYDSETGSRAFDAASFRVRGHNLTRHRGSPERLVSSVARSLLAATGNDPSRLQRQRFLDGLEAIRLGESDRTGWVDSL
jgi:hypothetical protein